MAKISCLAFHNSGIIALSNEDMIIAKQLLMRKKEVKKDIDLEKDIIKDLIKIKKVFGFRILQSHNQ